VLGKEINAFGFYLFCFLIPIILNSATDINLKALAKSGFLNFEFCRMRKPLLHNAVGYFELILQLSLRFLHCSLGCSSSTDILVKMGLYSLLGS